MHCGQFCFVSFFRGREGMGWISVDLLSQLAPGGIWHTPQAARAGAAQAAVVGENKGRGQTCCLGSLHLTPTHHQQTSHRATTNPATKYFYAVSIQLHFSGFRGSSPAPSHARRCLKHAEALLGHGTTCKHRHQHADCPGTPAVPALNVSRGKLGTKKKTECACFGHGGWQPL